MKWVGKKVKFKPQWSFEDMGGEDCIGLTKEEFEEYVDRIAVITEVDIQNDEEKFEDNYYTLFFSGELGELHAWSGDDLVLV